MCLYLNSFIGICFIIKLKILKMKKKKLIFFASFLAAATFIYVGCKKEKITDQKGKLDLGSIAISSTTPIVSDPLLIERQLRWIARGIPDLAQNNSNVKSNVETLASNPVFFAKNENIQNDLLNHLSINYQNSVYSNVNLRFTSNDYDSSLFYEFYFNNCLNLIGISIPELDIVDKTKPFIVIPSDDYNTQTDNYGYFLTTSGGITSLDSVIIDEDNVDDYYVWVVSVYDMCHDGLGIFSTPSGESCNNNNHCEEELGETYDNCADCKDAGKTNTKIAGRKDLYILDLKSTTDNLDKNSSNHPTEDYQENHLGGKYDITAAYAIIDMTNAASRSVPLKNIDFNDDKVHFLWHATAWGNNCDIKRCKVKKNGNSSCNRGIQNNLKVIDRLIYQNYDPTIHNIYLILSEHDLSGTGYKTHHIHDIEVDVPDNSNTQLQEEAHQKAWTSAIVGGTNTEILKIEHPGTSPLSGSGWSATTRSINGVSKTGFVKTFTLDGEMEMTIGFF